MSVADPPGTDRLSARLRAETRADHNAAQGSGFLDGLAAGRLPAAAYADLVAQHYVIYETLEQAALAMVDDPVAGDFVRPELNRVPALTRDLAFLVGPDWRDRIAVRPATSAYRARLVAVAFDRASAFVAHHYTRYLGDLSGGQYLGPAIAKWYGRDRDGHRFFVFEGVRPPAFRAAYRAMLDRISWPRADEDAFMAEVAEAYRLNIALLAELKDDWT
ncbi:MAG TPA: biliverdin-producing heme oxygenase [Actinoplanes sp.]|nr:biliverdin-producing heme oxygenase [Actinoplanes sp.]